MGADILAVADIQGNIYPLLNWWIFYIHEKTAWRPNYYSTFYLTRGQGAERPF